MSQLIDVRIEGISPLLMNRFNERSEQQLTQGTSAVHQGQKGSPREQAEPKAYRDENRNLILPGPNLYSAIIAAGRFHKVGKSQVTTTKTSVVPAGVQVLDLAMPLGTQSYEVDSRSVVIPSTGGRVMCHRPRLDKWGASFTLDVDTDVFTPAFVRQLLDDAGKKIGLGDFRPQRKGPFGRFVVCRWKERKS